MQEGHLVLSIMLLWSPSDLLRDSNILSMQNDLYGKVCVKASDVDVVAGQTHAKCFRSATSAPPADQLHHPKVDERNNHSGRAQPRNMLFFR